MAEFDELDDVLSTTGSAFLGLTIGCARCHDHKFDPIPQEDYYHLLSFFRNIRLSEAAKYTLDSPNYVRSSRRNAEEMARRAAVEVEAAPGRARRGDERDGAKETLEANGGMKNEKPPFDWALAVRERGSNRLRPTS